MKLCNAEVCSSACGKDRCQQAVLSFQSWRLQQGIWSDTFQAEMFVMQVDYCFLKQRRPRMTFSSSPSTPSPPGQLKPILSPPLNNLDNFSPKQRQRVYVLHSVVTSGRKAVTGSWSIGVNSQEFFNHLQGNSCSRWQKALQSRYISTPWFWQCAVRVIPFY